MTTLSPKKYIVTRARQLPIYKCFSVEGWEEGGIAQVVVMRKHVNGNITAGIYLVDLLCLGIKDTFFYFNTPEEELMERFASLENIMKEVDYDLAHNIIYAGHDFAMEYDIHPHRDFAITKFILEKDTDDIPLIEIPVGADDGKPHLLVDQRGEHADALAKLKKHAGEGNYYYTIAIEEGLDRTGKEATDDEKSDYSESADANEEYSGNLDDYEIGQLSITDLKNLKTVELFNQEKVSKRDFPEKMTISAEISLRILNEFHPEYFNEELIEDRPEYEYIKNADQDPDLIAGADRNFFPEFTEAWKQVGIALKELEHNDTSEAKEDALCTAILEKYRENPLVASTQFAYGCFKNSEILMLPAKSYLEKLESQYPLATLSLALGSLAKDMLENRFEDIYNQPDAYKAQSGFPSFTVVELSVFWLIQFFVHLRKDDLKNAIHYYELFAETEMFNWLQIEAQARLIVRIKEIQKKDEGNDTLEDSDFTIQ